MTQVTSGAPAGPVAFSTAGLPHDRRVELWETHNAEALIGLRCRTLDADALEATELNLQLRRVHLARVRGSSHVVERDRAMVRHRPADSVALFFSLEGEAFFYHDDGVRVVRPGQLLVCDADRPFLRGFSQGLEELVLKVPRALFAETTGVRRLGGPQLVDFAAGGTGTGPYAHALARQVGRAVRADDPAPVDEEALLGLLAALTGGGGDADLAAAHRSAATAYVEQHLADPGLSAGQVAAAIGISSRHLSRVLAGAGTSFPRLVLVRRLEAAHALLQQPAAAALGVAEVARRCGFTSAAHFSGAFTTHYGERASDVRRRAAVG
jgi:AraC-like DNA-binding protein